MLGKHSIPHPVAGNIKNDHQVPVLQAATLCPPTLQWSWSSRVSFDVTPATSRPGSLIHNSTDSILRLKDWLSSSFTHSE